ncbi:MAG TPA: hypothetical protein VGS22_27730 [Thermoanaerobaculia bacterium]|jgi:hypothetical protein|nr:hypothetical protein [Thermoanaerobaculia bacterium]
MEHIHPIEPIATVLLIVLLIYLRRKGKAERSTFKPKPVQPQIAIERPAKVEDPPEVVYAKLRRRALETTPEALGVANDVGVGDPYALLMEMGMPGTVVTLACFADGDAGVYYQTGGGMIGGRAHETVRQAAKGFIAQIKPLVVGMEKMADPPLPNPGRVRFTALTPEGCFTAETDREGLADPGNALSALYYSGQEVVSQMREVLAQKT